MISGFESPFSTEKIPEYFEANTKHHKTYIISMFENKIETDPTVSVSFNAPTRTGYKIFQ